MRKNKGEFFQRIKFIVLGLVAGIGAASVVRHTLPASMQRAEGLVFFGMILLVGGSVTFLSAKFVKRR